MKAIRAPRLGKYVKSLLTERGITQQELAEQLSLAIPSICRMLNGEQPITREQVIEMAFVCGEREGEFLGYFLDDYLSSLDDPENNTENSPETLLQTADELLRSNVPEARNYLKKAIESTLCSPLQRATAHAILGHSFSYEGKMLDACQCWEVSLSSDTLAPPWVHNVPISLGMALIERGYIKLGMTYLQNALDRGGLSKRQRGYATLFLSQGILFYSDFESLKPKELGECIDDLECLLQEIPERPDWIQCSQGLLGLALVSQSVIRRSPEESASKGFSLLDSAIAVAEEKREEENVRQGSIWSQPLGFLLLYRVIATLRRYPNTVCYDGQTKADLCAAEEIAKQEKLPNLAREVRMIRTLLKQLPMSTPKQNTHTRKTRMLTTVAAMFFLLSFVGIPSMKPAVTKVLGTEVAAQIDGIFAKKASADPRKDEVKHNPCHFGGS